MKFASWNVNSLKVRLAHLLEWLARQGPQIVCLQEIKLEDAKFPVEEIQAAGYHCAWSGQKTYNGVAILSRDTLADVVAGIPSFPGGQKTVVAPTGGGGGEWNRGLCPSVPHRPAARSPENDSHTKRTSA